MHFIWQYNIFYNKMGKSIRKCEVCGLRKRSDDIFFARFPSDLDRCRKWVKATGNEDLVYLPLSHLQQSKYICANHFSRKCFTKKKLRLKRNAVPNIAIKELPEELLLNLGAKNVIIPTDRTLVRAEGFLPSTTKRHFEATETSAVECLGPKSKQQRLEPETTTAPGFECLASTSGCSIEETVTSATGSDAADGSNFKTTSSIKRPQGVAEKSSTVDSQPQIPVSKREKELLARLRKARCALKTLASTSVRLDDVKSDLLREIVTEAIKNQSKKPQGKRWNLKNKISFLQIFKRSPKAYRFLQHQIPMPSTRTLQRLLKSVPMEPGINPAVLQNLKVKSEAMVASDKLCALLFDEISLKKRLIYNEGTDKVEGFEDFGPGECRGRRNRIADKALVFMIQGIRKRFKQPLAYYFVHGTISSENLVSLVNEIIRKVHETGLKILTTVCDQGPTNVGALTLLKKFSHKSPEENHFFVGEDKIFTMFDVPHLFKSIRNNFYEAGTMTFDGKKAQWKHLEDAEEINRGLLYFQKISSLLLKPKQRMKMKVKYAAQTLSNTFAAVLKMISEKHASTQYGQEVAQTSDVVRELDRLFDVTNGPASPKDIKKGIRENVSAKSNHIEKWNDFLKKLPTIQFLKSDSKLQLKRVRCVQGYKMTISALKEIWEFCKARNFKYLNLRQLNQDALENLFGVVRQHSPTNNNPTCFHFTSALKSVLISGMSAPHSRGANCENDSNRLFFNLATIDHPNLEEDPQLNENINPTEDYPVLSIPDNFVEVQLESDLSELKNQPLVYFSGYVAYKLLKGRDCRHCEACLKVDECLDDPTYTYIRLREWWPNKTSLVYPSISLCRTIEEAVKVFEVNNNLHIDNVGEILSTLMTTQCDVKWFSCDEHQALIVKNMFFIISRILIRRQCQIINDDFIKAEESSATANKIWQLQSIAK